jgi:hypothetical protein
MGAPFKWPWLTMSVGRSFVITAKTIESVRCSVSRAGRLWGVRYTIVKPEGRNKFRLRRVA